MIERVGSQASERRTDRSGGLNPLGLRSGRSRKFRSLRRAGRVIPPNPTRPARSHYCPDQCFPQMLAGIATYGARLGYEGTMSAKVRLHNHKSASELPHVVSNGIKEDLNLHCIQSVHPLPEAYYISPLGLVPKKSNGEPCGWRKIHDLFAPIRRSVNDGIPKHYGTIMYETFQHALRLVSEAGKGAILIKRD